MKSKLLWVMRSIIQTHLNAAVIRPPNYSTASFHSNVPSGCPNLVQGEIIPARLYATGTIPIALSEFDFDSLTCINFGH